MAEDPSTSPAPTPAPAPAPAVVVDSNSVKPQSDSNPTPQPDAITFTPPPPPAATTAATQQSVPITSYGPPLAPSFRPVTTQFYQNPTVVVPPTMSPYQVQLPGQIPRPPFAPIIPNGYQATSVAPAPPGILRYPSPYPAMVRPIFPPRPPGALGAVPVVPRPPVPAIPGVRPVISPVIRPVVPSVTPAEKPQTTVYVGKIAPSVENEFMLSLLQFCGPVKSWKRAQVSSDGTPRAFGFCEFESADGVLRALRLLTKFNIDGQELMLNVNQATKEYLERYVQKKTENLKNLKESQAVGADKEDGTAVADEKDEPPRSSVEDSSNNGDKGNKENHDFANFGIVTDEDKQGDREALEKLTGLIEERLKTKPLPPPPPPSQAPADGSGNSNLELPSKSKDGDSDVDTRSHEVEAKNEDETTSNNKAASEQDRPETISPNKSRGYDRRSRDRDRERDLKREKEREIERYERETERERIRKDREQRRKLEEAGREYEERLKDWEYREREKEKQRQYEKEREKEADRKRRKEILHDEEDEDDDSSKRWRRNALDSRRRKRLREKEEDRADRLKEQEEIAETKRREEEEKLKQQQRDASKLLSGHVLNGSEKTGLAEGPGVESKEKAVEQNLEGESGNENHIGDGALGNGTGDGDESNMASMAESDTRQSGSAPARKLGFGLLGSGKRAAVPSVFHDEDDDDAHKEKKMRPLVPIDYSTEELQAVQPTGSGAQPPNLAAAAEFAKRISITPREEKPDAERERSRRSHDRSSQRDRDRNDDDIIRNKDENKEKILDRDRDRDRDKDRNREHGLDKVKTPDKQKLLDAKQLIDMIPKTKEELFSYEINWSVYDKNELHERMRPWISKKITEFLGEEETTLVDYIVTTTQQHVQASKMLEMLQAILDDEAEMFVLKMWRMLIFEIKKVETGLSLRSK